MDKQRDVASFVKAIGGGLALSIGLLVCGEFILKRVAPDLDPSSAAVSYMLVAGGGVGTGLLLGLLVRYFPSLEGFLCSLAVLARYWIRDDFQIGLDNVVELLLKFESFFAALYLTAFVIFLARGGGLFYPFFVGLRYLRFKMITAISVVGVALGVAAMIVVLSVMSGFETDLKEKIVGVNAHAIVQKIGTDFTEYRTVLEKIKRVPGVVAASPFVYNEVMVSSAYNIAGIFIRGIDIDTSSEVTDMNQSIEEGSLDLLRHPEKIDAYLDDLNRKDRLSKGEEDSEKPLQNDMPIPQKDLASHDERHETLPSAPADATSRSPHAPKAAAEDEIPVPEPLIVSTERAKPVAGILIGKELRKILRVNVGDRINVVSPLSEELGPAGPVPKARAFRVAGVFYTGMYEYDAKSVAITLKDAQNFFGMDDSITGIQLRFDNLDRAGKICNEIVSALDGSPYYTRTWYQMNGNLFSALKMEKIGMFILVVIVTLVSSFGIISTLIMLVWEKIKEIAILKSMGSTGDGVMKIFMFEGIAIGVVGTALGLIMGFGVCEWLMNYGIQLNSEVYYIEKLPVNLDSIEFILIAGIALHISFIATIYPANRASRLRPVEGLRYD